jgi:hypothetical protein
MIKMSSYVDILNYLNEFPSIGDIEKYLFLKWCISRRLAYTTDYVYNINDLWTNSEYISKWMEAGNPHSIEFDKCPRQLLEYINNFTTISDTIKWTITHWFKDNQICVYQNPLCNGRLCDNIDNVAGKSVKINTPIITKFFNDIKQEIPSDYMIRWNFSRIIYKYISSNNLYLVDLSTESKFNRKIIIPDIHLRTLFSLSDKDQIDSKTIDNLIAKLF